MNYYYIVSAGDDGRILIDVPYRLMTHTPVRTVVQTDVPASVFSQELTANNPSVKSFLRQWSDFPESKPELTNG